MCYAHSQDNAFATSGTWKKIQPRDSFARPECRVCRAYPEGAPVRAWTRLVKSVRYAEIFVSYHNPLPSRHDGVDLAQDVQAELGRINPPEIFGGGAGQYASSQIKFRNTPRDC